MGDSGDPAGDGATVVVADDEPKVTDLYAGYLEPAFDVRRAYDGEGALGAVDEDVDVVLLDRQMPDMSGDEVLDAIREEGYDCQVVLVTALEPTMDIVDMPFDDYVVKPTDKAEINAVVERQLLRASHDAEVNEYLRLRSKIEVLREEKTEEELAESDRFEMLTVLAESLYDDLQEAVDDTDAVADVDDLVGDS
ncbi:response regulator transcription factor [Halostella salina]|uniref:response regulator transcription factor n=1 Tax=Halostella salina TaxID=1547897 RepID=UPI000EF7B530|nr:response regulator [Halostella salina]